MSMDPSVSPRRRPWRWVVGALVLVAVLIGATLIGATYYYDSVEAITPDRQESAVVARLDEDVRYAFVAAVDPAFYERTAARRSGLDPAVLTRAYVRMATADDSGGLRETVIAAKLEDQYSRDEIVAFYLGGVDFGRGGGAGVQAAAQAVFHHDAVRLTVAEAAVLGAMLNQREDPAAYPDLKARWAEILQVMVDRDWLSPAARDAMAYPAVS